MTVIQFPVFVKGQTLTDDDLNELRDSLEGIDRRIGRSVGFGINAGLGGSIAANTTLTIDTGIGIDQLGNVLEIDAPMAVTLSPNLNPAPSTAQRPAFLEGTDGFTPVLMLTTTEVPAAPCNEAGCEGHAKQRKLSSVITIFPGKLKDAIVDFGEEKLLAWEPLLVKNTGTVAGAPGSFTKLRDAIVDRMGDLLNADAKAKLGAMTVDGDVTAIQSFKAGFLNQVFFAALDLLRCELEMSQSRATPANGVGIALGWLHKDGTDWKWDCRYRHDWDVPQGVALALIGGECSSPCDLYEERLNSLINAFEVPVTPAPPDDPDEDGPVLCYELPSAIAWTYPYTKPKVPKGCDWVDIPPEFIDPDWRKFFHEKVPFPPIPPEEMPGLIYKRPPTDWAQKGKITLTDAIGKKSGNVVKELTNILTLNGNTTPVDVMTQLKVKNVADFQHGLVVGAGDRVIVVEDALHKVIGMGSVPANRTMVEAVAEVPKISGMAKSAEAAAKTAMNTAATFEGKLGTFDQALKGFTTFQTNVLAWQSSVDKQMGGLPGEIDAKALAAVGQYQLAAQGKIDERIGAAINVAKEGLLAQVHAEMESMGTRLKADVNKDLQQQTKALRVEVEADQDQLTQNFADLGQNVAELAGQVKTATRDAERSLVRIDDVLAAPQFGIGGVRDVVDADVLSVMGNMRESILAAATTTQRPKVEAALAVSEDSFKALVEATAGGPVILESQRAAIGDVLVSMTSAVEAAGAPATDVTKLRSELERLITG